MLGGVAFGVFVSTSLMSKYNSGNRCSSSLLINFRRSASGSASWPLCFWLRVVLFCKFSDGAHEVACQSSRMNSVGLEHAVHNIMQGREGVFWHTLLY